MFVKLVPNCSHPYLKRTDIIHSHRSNEDFQYLLDQMPYFNNRNLNVLYDRVFIHPESPLCRFLMRFADPL